MISLLKQQFFAIGAHLSQALYNLFISELRWNTQQQVFKLAQRIQQHGGRWPVTIWVVAR